MVIASLYPNIRTLTAGIYSTLPPGSELLRSEIVTEADGSRVQVDTYTNPFRGTFQLRTFLTQAERRAQLVPINPLLPAPAPIRKPSSVDPTTEKRKDTTADRRSVPRPGRDPRAPNPGDSTGEKDGENFGKDRRTGGPLVSFLAEAKSFFVRPAGIVTLAVVFLALYAATRRRKAATGTLA